MKNGAGISSFLEIPRLPKTGQHIGVGFWGAGRGYLTHHCVIEDGVLANYQIVTPSTVNACPRTPWGTPGPYEQAVLNTPLIESSFKNAEDFRGRARAAVKESPTPVAWFVLNTEAIVGTDITALDALESLRGELTDPMIQPPRG